MMAAAVEAFNIARQVEMAAQYANNEMKRLRSDHDQAISNLAENMGRWNDTVRDLSKEFHDFQKVMNVNQQRLQSAVWDVQGKLGQGASPVVGPQVTPATCAAAHSAGRRF
ncbi:unnamed protein product [Effrenium voratum]|nr:unnamed protein product [Effrenium voratum]